MMAKKKHETVHGDYVMCRCFRRDGWPDKITASTIGDRFFYNVGGKNGMTKESRPLTFYVKGPSKAGLLTLECPYCGTRHKLKVHQ